MYFIKSYPGILSVKRALCLLVLLAIGSTVSFAGSPPLKDRINETAGRAVYVNPSSITEKVCTWADVKKWFSPKGEDALRMPYPENLKDSGISEAITLECILTPEGKAINPKVLNIKNKELAIPAVLHLAGLKFERPKLNGKPVYCRQKVKVICSENPEFGKKKKR